MTPCRDGNRNRSCDGTARGVVELVMACIRNLVPQSQPEAIRVGALAKDEYHRAVTVLQLSIGSATVCSASLASYFVASYLPKPGPSGNALARSAGYTMSGLR
jgi:hypothetical protein